MGTKRKAAPSGNGNPCSNSKHSKGSQTLSQLQTVRLCCSTRPKTMLEVSAETGIRRANVCRYVGKLRMRGQIAVVRYGLCPISKYRAGFYTTDPELIRGQVNE